MHAEGNLSVQQTWYLKGRLAGVTLVNVIHLALLPTVANVDKFGLGSKQGCISEGIDGQPVH